MKFDFKPPEGFGDEWEVYDPITGKKWKTIEEYHKYKIKNEFIDEDGSPLKCIKCKGEKLDVINYYDGFTIIKKEVICKQCEAIVGNWNHGNWEIIC